MKILCYGINFWPEFTGCGKYTSEMVSWLVAKGHEVEMVTAPPYYPEWKIGPGYSAWKYIKEKMPSAGGKVMVRRSPLWVPRKVTGLSRIAHLASFAILSIPSLFAALRSKPDLLFVVLPTLAALPASLVLGRLFGTRIWVHVQDFEVDAAFSLNMVKSGKTQRIAVAAESALLRLANRVSSITPRMLERLRAKGILAQNAFLFPNWVDLASIFPLQGNNAFRAELGLEPDDVLCLYAGNMGEKQGLELVIDAAQALQTERRLRFVFAGGGTALGRLQAQSASLNNVTWLPVQPSDRLNLILNAADVHMLPQRGDAADLVMPSKLTGMLASGRAVLGTANSGTQLGNVLDAVGVRSKPGDVAEFVAQLRALSSDAPRRSMLGRLGREYAEEHLALDRIMARFLAEASLCCGMHESKAEAVLKAATVNEPPEYVVSMNCAYVARVGGVLDFAKNLVRAMAPLVGPHLSVVEPVRKPGPLGQILMRYIGEVNLEFQYWRRHAVALFPNYFIFPLPFTWLRRVVVVHDLQFKHYPHYTHPLKRLVLDVSYRCARRFADGVVFISAATRDDFLHHYGMPKKHAVIYNPITIEHSTSTASVRPYPYVVANFHFYPHKNLGRLVAYYKALRMLWPELRLVLTGHKPPNLDTIVGGDLASFGVEHLGYVSKEEVIMLVKGAAFFMSLSQFEGFNMSAAEAALLGKPIVLSDIPVHREVFGDVAFLVDPDSTDIPVRQIIDHVRTRPAEGINWAMAYRVAPATAARKYHEFMRLVYSAS